jgi:hypothetical protein
MSMQSYSFFRYPHLFFSFLILAKSPLGDIYQSENKRNRIFLRKFADNKKVYDFRNDRD